MKKILAFVLTIAMLATLVCASVFATVSSPDLGDDNGADGSKPTSPATGAVISLAGAAVIALASGSAVVLTANKARKGR